MESATQVQILGKAVSILLHTNVLGKGMIPLLLPAMGKIVEQTRFLSLG